MKPFLISNTFDLLRLKDSENKPVFDSNNLAIYVQNASPSVPTNNGLGVLEEATYCRAHHVLNGEDEIELRYPVDGQLFNMIQLRALIVAKVDRTRGNQPYRIYRITKPINGIVTIYARHLVYDLSGIVVEPFSVTTISDAMAGIKSHAMTNNPFTFTTTRTTAANFKVAVPTSAWSLMGGQQGSLLDVYGGEYTFDGYTVTLENSVGQNNGVSVRYGVNMTDFEQDANIENCYTGVVAYWSSIETGEVVYSPVVSASGTYGYTKILSVDMSDRWETKPTDGQLKSAASSYITNNQIGVPKVSWTINFVPLDTTEEYKNVAILERVSLGDTVGVKFEKLGVDATARVREIKWDVLLDRYVSVSLGSIKNNLANTIAKQTEEIKKIPTTKQVQDLATRISKTLTNAILGADGGSVRLLDTNNDGEPDTLYIADNPDPAQAVKVWRFNYQGWGASSNGYNGPFTLGATLDNGLLANFVTAANLVAGTIRSADGTTFNLDLDNGTLSIGGYASKAELASSGGTTINGGNITTGTINANLITTGTLKSQNDAFSIAMNNGILNATLSDTYLAADYSSTDVDRVRNILLGSVTPTSADKEKYDFYKDGSITVTDLAICQAIVNSNEDLTITWTVKIDPTNRNRILVVKMDKTGAQSVSNYELLAVGLSGASAKVLTADSITSPSIVESGYDVNWAAIGTQITANTDIRSLTPGRYYCSSNSDAASLTNCPTAKNFAMIVYDRNTSSNRRNYVIHDANNDIYINAQTGNTAWSGWKKITTTSV